MSLLLDALRRASAAREDPAADRYTVPHRAVAPEPIRPADGAAGADPGVAPEIAASDAMAVSPVDEDELALLGPDEEPGATAAPTPTVDGHDAAAHPASPDPASVAPAPGPADRSDHAPGARERERATADALLRAGVARRRGRGSLILGLASAGLLAAGALAGGGWLYYQQSRSEVAGALSTYRPQDAPAEMIEAAAASRADEADRDEAANRAAPAGAPVGGAEADTDLAASPPGQGDTDGALATSGTATGPDDAPVADAAAATAEDPDPVAVSSADPGPVKTGAAVADSPATSEEPEPAQEPIRQASAQESPPAPGEAPIDAPAPAERTAPEAPAPTAGTIANAAGNAPAQARPATEPAEPQRAATPRTARPLIRVARTAPLAEALNIGYDALLDGDLTAADAAYGRARTLAPDNRDALLGAATVRERQGARAAARRLYRRVLDAHPRDPHARAALAALGDGRTPRADETELKMLLREMPDAPALNYALGNLYAAESRWSDARQAYARAARAASDSPDYAYNLAVALDHLGQRDAAGRAYERALRLAIGVASAFEPRAVRRRLQQLR